MEGTAAATIMESATTALTSSFTDIASGLAGLIGSILPVALPIVGVGILVAFGLKTFKKVTGKA